MFKNQEAYSIMQIFEEKGTKEKDMIFELKKNQKLLDRIKEAAETDR